MARAYNESSADELAFLDVAASAQHRDTMFGTVAEVAEELYIPLTVGGGIRTITDIKKALRKGADKVLINSGAVSNPDFINDGARTFGSQCIVVAIDVRRRYDHGGEYYTEVDGESCWFECTVESDNDGTEIDAVEWATSAAERGAGELLVSSMDADGTRKGYEIPLMNLVCDAVSTPVMAASGCGSPQDVYKLFTNTDVDAALAASIFHYDEYTVEGVKEYLSERGIPIRME